MSDVVEPSGLFDSQNFADYPGGDYLLSMSETTSHSNLSGRRANHLAGEKSPYLLQHQFNPVDWRPWGAEAFARARAENRPIFLSIGYSTCHWCHVMERESFEDPAVADFLNQNFVSIKVDREERPDVDKIYMTAVQAMAGQGGWPLTAFLTTDLKPFYGGTYFPPSGRHGRPGFLDLLRQIAEVWRTRSAEVQTAAEDLHSRLAAWADQTPAHQTKLHENLLAHGAAALKQEYDPVHGGFGGAPKFPQPSGPLFLLQFGQRFKDREATNMVLETCRKMAAGGIHDQLGGGFARYSVDAQWLVPHFEKMLYDNAQLLDLNLDAFLVSGDESLARAARGIVEYLLRDMTHPDGGFYSAEDADSEGKEGKFYCWTLAECRELLSPDEAAVAIRHFGITAEGNFVDHSDPDPLPGQNVLSVVDDRLDAHDQALLASAQRKMFAVRSRRVRPHLDDKVLASWNGLMLGALARAGLVLGDAAALAAARRNSAFIRARLWDAPGKTLYHRWCDGERDTVQLLDAYAYQVYGHLALYESTLEQAHLDFAVALAEAMLSRFYDAEQGGFWQSEATSDLILRVKEDYDGAQPSGNSVAVHGLLKLAALTGRGDLRAAADKTLQLYSQRMARLPQSLMFMLRALDFTLAEPVRIVVNGDLMDTTTAALLKAANSVYHPCKIISHEPGQGTPAAHICIGKVCLAPTSEPATLSQMLSEARREVC